MSKIFTKDTLRGVGIPVLLTAFYLLFAIVFSAFMNNSLVVTLLDDITVAVLGAVLTWQLRRLVQNRKQISCYLNHGTSSDVNTVPDVKFTHYLIMIGFLVLIWFVCQIMSLMIYNTFGDSNLDKYNTAANSNVYLYGVLSVIIAPITEEILMRGVWFGYIKTYCNTVLAYILSAVVFAVLHGTLVHLPTSILFGLFLCFVYDYTDMIIVAIIMHFGFNLFSVLLSGIVIPDFMISVSFAGITYTVMLIVVIIGIIMLYMRRMPELVSDSLFKQQ